MTELRWCSGCFTEWYKIGERYIFDDKRKTPRFAWAKAIQKSGGIRMGGGQSSETDIRYPSGSGPTQKEREEDPDEADLL